MIGKRLTLLFLWIFTGISSATATTSSEYLVQQGTYNGIKTYYLDPGKQLVLIHGDVITPIPVKKPGNYYELYWNGSRWVLGQLTEAEWRARSKGALTDYQSGVTDFNGDGIEDLLLVNGSSRVLVSGTGDALSVENPDEILADYQEKSVVGGYVQKPATSSTLIGSTKGEFQVTSSGSASYQIPLSLPEGRNGMAPKLSINYDSMGGEGNLGIGFSLSAGSSIHRCTKNRVLDNVEQRPKVQLSKADRLCIDGERLFLLGTHAGDTVSDDAYWASGSTYYTEPDTFIRVRAVGALGMFPKYFEVKDKQNRTRYYGAGHPYERQSNATHLVTNASGQLPYAWALGTDVDALGNTIHYQYEGNPYLGSHTLKKILYTGFKNEQTPFAQVSFSYQARKAYRFLYRAGAKLTNGNLLVGIEVKVDGELFRSYHLSYLKASKAYESRHYLESLQECALENGKEECLSPITFQWRQRDKLLAAVPKSIDGSQNIEFNTYEKTISGVERPSMLKRLVDYDGDGKADLQTSRNKYYNLFTGQELTHEYYPVCDYVLDKGEVVGCSNDSSIMSGIPSVLLGLPNDDINNDGIADDVRVTSYHANVSFFGYDDIGVDQWFVELGRINYKWIDSCPSQSSNHYESEGYYSSDFNGDGLSELFYRLRYCNPDYHIDNGLYYYESYKIFTTGLAGNKPFAIDSAKFNLIDINGDGFSDYSTPRSQDKLNIYLNKGGSLHKLEAHFQDRRNDFDSGEYLFSDINADGRDDIVYIGGSIAYFYVRNGFDVDSYRYTYAGQTSIGFTPQQIMMGDANGDGIQDLVAFKTIPNYGDEVTYKIFNLARYFASYDMVKKITESNGKSIDITYKPISEDGFLQYKAPRAGYLKDEYSPMGGIYLVNSVTTDSPATDGGSRITSQYRYGGLKYDLGGHGWLGFERIDQFNKVDNSNTTTFYHQDYPFIGKIKSREHYVGTHPLNVPLGFITLALDTATRQREDTYVWKQASSQDGGIQVYQQSHHHWQADNALTVNTTVNAIDKWGNATSITTTRTVPDSMEWKEVLTRRFDNEAERRLGLPGRVDSRRTFGGIDERSTSFDYDASGLLKTEILNLNTPQQLTRSYSYDRYGNLTRRDEKGMANASGGEATRSESYDYGANGRFLDTVVNAVGHVSRHTYNGVSADSAGGVIRRITTTGANGEQQELHLNGLGQLTGSMDTTGVATSIRRGWCTISNCELSRAHYWILTETDGQPASLEFYDRFDQLVERRTTGFGGEDIVERWQYDWRGLTLRVYAPDYGAQSSFYTDYGYDLLGRKISKQVVAADGEPRHWSWSYRDNEVTETNPRGNQRIETRLANGELGKLVEDIKSDRQNTTVYSYDSWGNLTGTMINEDLGTKIVVGYNAAGQKTSLDDPNKGHWQYTYNAFNELVEQMDGRGVANIMSYDGLGRLKSRRQYASNDISLAPVYTHCFTYDQLSQGSGKGYLSSQATFKGQNNCSTTSGAQFVEHYRYDKPGRMLGRTTTIHGSSYQTDYSYYASGAGAGKLKSIRYPASGSKGRLTVYQRYGFGGYLNRVEEGDGRLIRQINAMDPLGNVTDERLGNGITQQRTFDPGYGGLGSVTARSRNNSLQLLQAYEYDANFNLKEQRHTYVSYKTIYSEQKEFSRFQYDKRDRLSQWDRLLSSSYRKEDSYRYDLLGNLIHTDKNGDYQYGSANPYRLTKVDDLTFQYDAIGNVTADGKRVFDYGIKEKPTRITQGQDLTTLEYGPDDSRFRRTDVRYEGGGINQYVTDYVGKLFEKISRSGMKGSITEYKHYIGDLVLTRRSNATEDRYFLLKDSLGSVLMVTDNDGNEVQRLSYTPFGKQIRLHGNGLLDKYLLPTRRAFTGHEQIEGMDLLHMNGRVYNPVIGRFMQADPFIPYPDKSQSFNRYSYARNNPLRLIDPSGYYDFGAVCTVDDPQGTHTRSSDLSGSGSGSDRGSGSGSSSGNTTPRPVVVVGSAVCSIDVTESDPHENSINIEFSIGCFSGENTGGKFANGAVTAAFATAVSAGVQAARKPTPQEVTYAKLANGVYDPEFTGADGYTRVKTFTDDNGLQAALFVDEAGHYVLAFAGTDPSSWANWKANLSQAFGGGSAQYDSGIALAREYYAATGGNIHFTGHSLGGGIASVAAIWTGGSATVFNAAGVHANTLGGYAPTRGSVTYFYSSFDVLRLGNALTPAGVPGEHVSLGATGLHSMGGICRAMGC